MGITKVSDYMNSRMITGSSNATLFEVAKIMTEFGISSVAIVDDEDKRVIGIITERDIVRNISTGKSLAGIRAQSIMSTPPISVNEDVPIEEAAFLMLKRKVRHLLVETANHKNVGIITATDLARYLRQEMAVPTVITTSSQGQECSPSMLTGEVWELFF